MRNKPNRTPVTVQFTVSAAIEIGARHLGVDPKKVGEKGVDMLIRVGRDQLPSATAKAAAARPLRHNPFAGLKAAA